MPDRTSEVCTGVTNLYADLCDIEVLKRAFAEVEEHLRDHSGDTTILQAAHEKGVERFVRDLGGDLQKGGYQPSRQDFRSLGDFGSLGLLRDLVVQAAMRGLLEPVFAPVSPSGPPSEKAVMWVAHTIRNGLTRVYAERVEVLPGAVPDEQVLENLRRRVDDAEFVGLFKRILERSPEPAQRTLLAPVLVQIAFEEIDRILQEAKALGRREAMLHVNGARFGDELILLVDGDIEYDWVLPAVRSRVLEASAKCKLEVDSERTQLVDLSQGEKLKFLECEFRYRKSRDGLAEVECKALGKPLVLTGAEEGKDPVVSEAGAASKKKRKQESTGAIRSGRGCLQALNVSWRDLLARLGGIFRIGFGWGSLWPVSKGGATSGRNRLQGSMGAKFLGAFVFPGPCTSYSPGPVQPPQTVEVKESSFMLITIPSRFCTIPAVAWLLFLSVPQARCAEQKLGSDPLHLAQEAFLSATKNLRSGIGSALLEMHIQQANSAELTLLRKANVKVFFDSGKYHLRMEYEENDIYVTKQIIIYDHIAIISSSFWNVAHPTQCEGYIHPVTSKLPHPRDRGFPWDVTQLSKEVLDFDELLKQKPRDSIRMRKVSEGRFEGSYSLGKPTAYFEIDSAVGFNVVKFSAMNEGEKKPVQQCQVEWKKAKDIWYINSLLWEMDLRSRGGILTRCEFTYRDFEPNAKVAPELFSFDALELREGARILDQRPDAKQKTYINRPIIKTDQGKLVRQRTLTQMP